MSDATSIHFQRLISLAKFQEDALRVGAPSYWQEKIVAHAKVSDAERKKAEKNSDFSDIYIPLASTKIKETVDEAIAAWETLGGRNSSQTSSYADSQQRLAKRVEDIKNSVPNVSEVKRELSESLHSVEVCNSGVGAESAYTDKIEEAKGSTFDILHPSNQPSVPPHRANDDPVLRSIAPSNRHGGAGSHSSGNGSIIPHDVVLEITVYCPKATCSRKGSGKRLYPAKANTFLFHWNQSLSELPAVVQCWEDKQIERMNNRKKTCASGAGGGGNDGTVKRPWLNQASFMYIEGNFFDDVAQTEDASAQGQRQGNARKRPGGKLSSSLLKFLNADPSKFPHLCTMQNFVCKSMRGTKFRDLAIRLNTPYVYCHNGDCEHPFVFSDVRMFESTDPGHPSMYPFLTFQRHHNRAICFGCKSSFADVICHEDSAVGPLPCPLCTSCFEATHEVSAGGKNARKKRKSHVLEPYVYDVE